MKDHGKLVDVAVELLSQGLSGNSEAKIVASIRKNGLVDTAEAVQIVKEAKIKIAAKPKKIASEPKKTKLEELKEKAEAAAKALKEAEEAARQAEREAKAAEEKAKALLKVKETQSTKIQILTQMHKVLVTSFKDSVLETPEATDPYRSKEPNIKLSPGSNYPYISVQARYTADSWNPRFKGWEIALTLESFGKTRVYPALSSGGYSYDKIVKVIKEYLETKAAVEKREAEEKIRKTRKTDLAGSVKKELGLKEDSALVQGVLEQGYCDYRGRWCPTSYEASDGHVWLNLGSRQCTPEQAKIMINAMRMAGFKIK